MFWSFSFQICLLSSILFSFSRLVKDALWDVYRVLKPLAVSPIYFLLLLAVVTVASYITLCVVHFPGRGLFSLLRQLHVFILVVCCFQDFVVCFDNVSHIANATVAQLQSVLITYFLEFWSFFYFW